MHSHYQRMTDIALPLFKSGDTITRSQLYNTLVNHKLLKTFELTYWADCYCGGDWSFFDFSDRFARFANALTKQNKLAKVGRGKYKKL